MIDEHGPGGRFDGQSPVEIALTYLAVRETAPNRGPAVDIFIASVGLDPAAGSYPWCQCFIYHCCHEAGRWFPMTASVHRAWEQGRSLRVGRPRYGDVAIRLNADGTGHSGFVLQSLDSSPQIETVDGNSGEATDRVAIMIRLASWWSGFLRPYSLRS